MGDDPQLEETQTAFPGFSNKLWRGYAARFNRYPESMVFLIRSDVPKIADDATHQYFICTSHREVGTP